MWLHIEGLWHGSKHELAAERGSGAGRASETGALAWLAEHADFRHKSGVCCRIKKKPLLPARVVSCNRCSHTALEPADKPGSAFPQVRGPRETEAAVAVTEGNEAHTSRWLRSSSAAASLFLAQVNRLKLFSAPRYVSCGVGVQNWGSGAAAFLQQSRVQRQARRDGKPLRRHDANLQSVCHNPSRICRPAGVTSSAKGFASVAPSQ